MPEERSRKNARGSTERKRRFGKKNMRKMTGGKRGKRKRSEGRRTHSKLERS